MVFPFPSWWFYLLQRAGAMMNSLDRALSGCTGALARTAMLGTALLTGFPGADSAHAQTEGGPPSNLSVLRQLAETVGRRAGDPALAQHGDTVTVRLQAREAVWFLEASLLAGLRDHGEPVRAVSEGEPVVTLAPEDIEVRYEDPRSDGLLGSTLVDRIVHLSFSAVLLDTSGTVRFSDTMTESFRDTVALSLIPTLENPNIPATQASLPDEGWFSGIAGPIIIVGALGVAVFLLFHVRS